MVGIKVKHAVFGSGVITAQDGNYLSVEFSSKTCRFIYYPDTAHKKSSLRRSSCHGGYMTNTYQRRSESTSKRKSRSAGETCGKFNLGKSIGQRDKSVRQNRAVAAAVCVTKAEECVFA